MNNSQCLAFLKERGLIKQQTHEDIFDKNFCFYIGTDLTGDLHIGSLLALRVVEILQKFGNQAIIIFGGATSRIGDPSGKTSQRKVLTQQEIQINKNRISNTVRKIISGNVVFLDNSQWIDKINYIEMLKDYGSFVSVNRMVKMDTIKDRLDNNVHLSFLEFNYSLLQAIDFIHLYKNYNCTVQIGGSDQWCNIISGIDLGQKIFQKDFLKAFTFPLLTTSDGNKMGKTEKGAMFLEADKTDPFDLWQFFRSIEDFSVEKLLLMFSDEEVSSIKSFVEKDINASKIKLADLIVGRLHGQEQLEKIHSSIKSLFGNGDINEIPEDLRIKINRKNFNEIKIEDLLILCQLATSRGEAKRQIINGDIRVNDKVLLDSKSFIIKDEFKGLIKISYGKKQHKVLEVL
jgi:tyrosyl-tRNA synthetase